MKVSELISLLAQSGISPDYEVQPFVNDEGHIIDLELEVLDVDPATPVVYLEFGLRPNPVSIPIEAEFTSEITEDNGIISEDIEEEEV